MSGVLTSSGYLLGEEIQQSYDSFYIVWSIVIAAFGAYVAFTTTMYMKQVVGTYWYWIMLVQAGLALGFSTIWCMHYVGMNALHLQGGVVSGASAEVPITFEPLFTITSALAAWCIATIALHIALSQTGINVRGESSMSSRRTSRFDVRDLKGSIRDAPVKRIAFASILVTAGVCVMHYMGMLSQSGKFTMSYNVAIMIASAFVAAAASTAGLSIFFFLSDRLAYRAAASLVVSLAVNGMHYTGMESARYYASEYNGVFGEGTVSWAVEPVTVLIGVLLLNFFLMAAMGYYVEVLEMVRRREGEAFEKELRHKNYCKESRQLIERSRVMRYPMCLIRFDTFVRQGKLMSHEHMRDANKLVYINTSRAAMKYRQRRFIVFFSHQWLSGKVPDPANRQFQDMINALVGLSKLYRVKTENMFIWVDYSSIPQEGLDQQQLAIDSIATYVSVASAFVIVAPQVIHTETQTPCNFMTYSKRCWCRLEVFCSLLSTLRHKTGSSSSLAIPEEDFLEDDDDPHVATPQDTTRYDERCMSESTGALPPPPVPINGAVQACGAYLHQATSARRDVNFMSHSTNSPKPSKVVELPLSVAGSTTNQNHTKSEVCERSDSALQEMHRVFLVVDEKLHRLNFFTPAGTLRKEYEELLYVFNGDLECCMRGHHDKDGRQIVCDKMKLVPSLCGCYGAMLVDVKRSRRAHRSDARTGLAEHIIKLRTEIFPDEYFDTRIDAIESQVHFYSSERGDHVNSGDGTDAETVDSDFDSPEDTGTSESSDNKSSTALTPAVTPTQPPQVTVPLSSEVPVPPPPVASDDQDSPDEMCESARSV